MIYQNNNNALVILAFVAMILCGILGLVLGLDPFGPGQSMRMAEAGTKVAIGVQATEAALYAMQTPQAIYANQRLVAAQLTAMPMNQTATEIAKIAEIKNAQATATQNALDVSQQVQRAAGQATQMYIAQQQTLSALAFNGTATSFAMAQPVRSNSVAWGMGGIGVLAFSLWIGVQLFIQAARVRMQEKIANAHFLLAEQRRLRALQGSGRAPCEKKNVSKTVPITLLPNPKNGRGLPRAE